MTTPAFAAACIQHACADDRDENLRRSERGIRSAHSQGAQLVVLSELHTSRYFCQSRDTGACALAEPLQGPTQDWLADLARELSIVLIGSIFERDGERCFNTAFVIERDGSTAGRYRKVHLPDDPGYYERYYFSPGEDDFSPIATSLGKLGLMLCWDQWFPEAARAMALAGADVLIYPSAIGWEPADDDAEQRRQLDAWQTVQRGHAIANVLPLMACNRHGFEPDPSGERDGIQFWGHSFIAGPQGEILAQVDNGSDAVCMATIDPVRSAAVRREWPLLDDRRPGFYRKLIEPQREP